MRRQSNHPASSFGLPGELLSAFLRPVPVDQSGYLPILALTMIALLTRWKADLTVLQLAGIFGICSILSAVPGTLFFLYVRHESFTDAAPHGYLLGWAAMGSLGLVVACMRMICFFAGFLMSPAPIAAREKAPRDLY